MIWFTLNNGLFTSGRENGYGSYLNAAAAPSFIIGP